MSHIITTGYKGLELPCECVRGQDHPEEFWGIPLPTTTDGVVISPEDVLRLPMPDNDAGAATVREYLACLVQMVWQEQEGFSGKRPFGNSGWSYELIEALYEAGFLSGEHPPPGCGHTDEQDRLGHRLITEAIAHLGVDPYDEVPRLWVAPEDGKS